MAQHEDKHNMEAAIEPGEELGEDKARDADMDGVFSSIERELTSLVERCEQTTAQHAQELAQRQAEIDRTLQIAMKRQVEIDRQSTQLRGLAEEVVQAERSLGDRRRLLAERLRRRRRQLTERMTAAIDKHACRAAEEIEARAKELAQREAHLAHAQDRARAQADAAQTEREQLADIRRLLDEQASLTAEHARGMDVLLDRREKASLELIDRLTDACGLADRIRELGEKLRESRTELRDLDERASNAERERNNAHSALDAARARIAQLESRIESLSRDKLLIQQRAERLEQERSRRESDLARREAQLRREALRLSDDQAACDDKLRELGHKLGLHDLRRREQWLDPRTPLPASSMPLICAIRRRPDLRFVD